MFVTDYQFHLQIILPFHQEQFQDTTGTLVMEPEVPGKMPQGLARVTIQGRAHPLSESDPGYSVAKSQYLSKFPSAAELFLFPDFELVRIEVLSARLVGGFAQASSLSAETFARAITG